MLVLHALYTASAVSVAVDAGGAISAPSGARITPQLVFSSQYPNVSSVPMPLRANVERTISLNPDLRVRWLSDDECDKMLASSKLSDVYREKKREEGKYLSDLCRTALLEQEGGFYVDLDVELEAPMQSLVSDSTTFMSAWAYSGDNGILNAILAVAPHSQILVRTLDAMQASPGASDNWGPKMLKLGFDRTMQSCANVVAVRQEQFEACGESIRLFSEIKFTEPDSRVAAATRERAQAEATKEGRRAEGNFDGNLYAIVSATEDVVVGFSRFAACDQWGCDHTHLTSAPARVQEFKAHRGPIPRQLVMAVGSQGEGSRRQFWREVRELVEANSALSVRLLLDARCTAYLELHAPELAQRHRSVKARANACKVSVLEREGGFVLPDGFTQSMGLERVAEGQHFVGLKDSGGILDVLATEPHHPIVQATLQGMARGHEFVQSLQEAYAALCATPCKGVLLVDRLGEPEGDEPAGRRLQR